ncbi:hypothetical protein K437DRAFT_240138 [Tilletiaria anomala UBC 951]|uniref:PIPK domain-containing protein n=1 Tax=Tilletiaria anomala (strain ATCC 24038 / CBS 436.72 / UBC 951) TaxID=1037660 RepID=A0A066VIK9_TILAU|nr:uncharacterized protein K437DRAFT_240138 [Tilletiaria anomala UBC 951]KDN38395.1 hypothetical protein K437DRAFT_240138 [Tilletiaria anomala UBC 951]
MVEAQQTRKEGGAAAPSPPSSPPGRPATPVTMAEENEADADSGQFASAVTPRPKKKWPGPLEAAAFLPHLPSLTSNNSKSSSDAQLTNGQAPLVRPPLPSPAPSGRSVSGASIASNADAASISSAASIVSEASSKASSNSNWRATLELSLPTQRRLIRKPLPLLPGDGPSQKVGSSGKSGARANCPADGNVAGQDTASGASKPPEKTQWTRAELDEFVEMWWPEEMPPLDEAFVRHLHRVEGASSASADEETVLSIVSESGSQRTQGDELTDGQQGGEEEAIDEHAKQLLRQGLGLGLDLECEEHLKQILLHAWAAPTSNAISSKQTPAPQSDKDATLQAPNKASTTKESATGGDDDADEYEPLGETTAPQLFSATLDAMRYLSSPATMASLQRTAAMKWRAEIQLRSSLASADADAAHSPSGAAATSGSSAAAAMASGDGAYAALAAAALAAKGWAKLGLTGGGGWSAAALARAGGFAAETASALAVVGAAPLQRSHSSSHFPFSAPQDAQRGGTDLPHDAPEAFGDVEGAAIDQLLGEEERTRLRKRDVAIKILGNALWFARHYAALGSPAGTLTSQCDAEARIPREGGADGGNTLRASAAVRMADAVNPYDRMLDAATPVKPKKIERNALPQFPSKAAATTAITSGTEDSTCNTHAQAPTVDGDQNAGSDAQAASTTSAAPSAAPSPVLPAQTEAGTVLGVMASHSSPTHDAPKDAASTEARGQSAESDRSVRNPRAGPPKVSKAQQQLASLNIAAGVAFQAKARAIGDVGSSTAAADELQALASRIRTVAPTSSHASLRSIAYTLSNRNEAEENETAALERAKREYAEEISKQCVEWAKMVVCRTCIDLRVAGEPRTPSGAGGTRFGRHERSGTIKAHSASCAARMAAKRERPAQQASEASDRTLKSVNRSSQRSTVVWVPDIFEGEDLFPLAAGHWQDSDTAKRVRCVGGTFKVEVEEEDEGLRVLELLRLLVYAGSAMLLESAFMLDSGLAAPRRPPRSSSTALERYASVSSTATAIPLSQAQPSTVVEPTSSSDETGALTPRAHEHKHGWGRFWNILGSGATPEAQAGAPSLPPLAGEASSARSSLSLVHHRTSSDVSSHARRGSDGLPRSLTRPDSTSSPRKHRGKIAHLFKIISKSGGRDEKHVKQVDEAASIVVLQSEDTLTTALQAAAPLPRWERPRFAKQPARAFVSVSPRVNDSKQHLAPQVFDYVEHFVLHQHFGLLVQAPSGTDVLGARQNVGLHIADTPSAKYHSDSASHRSVSGRSATSEVSACSVASKQDVAKSSAATYPAVAGQHDLVRFYSKHGSLKDVPLGEVIEEICLMAAAMPLEQEPTAKSKSSASAQQAVVPPVRQVAVHYVNGGRLISLQAQASVTPKAKAPVLSQVKEAEKPTVGAKNDSEIKAVAAILHLDHDQARKALAAAENAVRVDASQTADGTLLSKKGIYMWRASPGRGKQSPMRPMSEATYLMSFSKFLEAMMYNAALQEQEVSTDRPWPPNKDPENDARLPPLRFFRLGDSLVKVSTRRFKMFHLHLQGPVLAPLDRTSALMQSPEPINRSLNAGTRLEIQAFFSSVKHQLTAMEGIFVARELDEHGKTIKLRLRNKTSFSSVSTPGSEYTESVFWQSEDGTEDTASTHSVRWHPLALLTRLRTSLRTDEFGLYGMLKETKPIYINDVRKVFYDCARSAKNRLSAWTRKHLTKDELKAMGSPNFEEPEYFAQGKHPFPGSSVLVREDEPLSIIAFSLTSRDFQREIVVQKAQHDEPDAAILEWRSGVSEPSAKGSSISSRSTSTKNSSRINPDALDPDQDEVFYRPEPVNAVMKRKKRNKEGSMLSLKLRRVASSISQPSERKEDVENEGPSFVDDKSPALVEPKNVEAASAAIEVNIQIEPAPDTDHTIGEAGTTTSTIESGTVSSNATNSTFRARITQVHRRPKSLASIFMRHEADASSAGEESSVETSSLADTTTPKDDSEPARKKRQEETTRMSIAPSALNAIWSVGSGFTNGTGAQDASKTEASEPTTTGSRLLQESNSSTAGTTASCAPPSTGKGTSSRAMPSSRLQDKHPQSPHIKHSLYHGKTKVSCVSWFAEEFAALREKWGVSLDGFAESLSRCHSWTASGGKSRSAFYKTADGRFLAKQLVTVWSVDEKEAFLEFAPSYIRYMAASMTKQEPTLLVKIAGVYSIKVKDTETHETKLKINVMILENLFADLDDAEKSEKAGMRMLRFDLKGIRDRRIKNANYRDNPDGHVWWDAEWIENYKQRAFILEAEMDTFQQALRNDTAFLTASNVMDYSLLVGVVEPLPKVSGVRESGDEGQERITSSFRVRIVDYIGAFTLAKQLESSSKKALKTQDGKSNVTILPPAEYAERFSNAMRTYFIGCPAHGWLGLDGTMQAIRSNAPWELERTSTDEDDSMTSLLPSVL